jgi:hypothetical protein
MIFWSLKIIFISVIFIFIIDNLILFFKDNLTVPKRKDYIYAPIKKYDDIFDTFKNKSIAESSKSNESDDMKQDLINFMKKQFS